MINLSAGPAFLLPHIKCQLSNFLSAPDTPLFQSHLSSVNQDIWEESKRLLRQFDKIPDDFEILLLPSSVRGTIESLADNLKLASCLDMFLTGRWGYSAYNLLRSKMPVRFLSPHFDLYRSSSNPVFSVSNETISGAKFHYQGASSIRICDMTSGYLSAPTPWDDIDCAIIGCQKIFSLPGATLVIIRRDSLNQMQYLKSPMNLRYQAQCDSAATTRSNLHAWMIGRVTQALENITWKTLISRRESWSKKLYNFIDSQPYLMNQVPEKMRSDVNITFSVDPLFKGLIDDFFQINNVAGISGHKSFHATYRLSFYPQFLAAQHDDRFVDTLVQSCSNILVKDATQITARPMMQL